MRVLPSLAAVLPALLVLAHPVAGQTVGRIDSVTIIPPAPTDMTPITVDVDGTSGSGPVTILGSDFTRDGNRLALDIDLEIGPLTVVTPWTHLRDIGLLPPGTYDLTVTATARTGQKMGLDAGRHQSTFTVVPEPAALAPMALALLALGRRRRPVDAPDLHRRRSRW